MKKPEKAWVGRNFRELKFKLNFFDDSRLSLQKCVLPDDQFEQNAIK